MSDPVPIEYREFHDVPRLFVASADGITYLFDGSFDDELDDYPDAYAVGTLPPLRPDELAGSWASLPARTVHHLGSVPVSAVTFDATRRRSVDRGLLSSMAARLRTTDLG
jgi:hypothetical protein